jgi:DNA polymerase-3 subunit delta'
MALRLEHPDLHWFFPLPRPKGVSGPERLGEALEEARAAELTARRANPWRSTAPGEPVGIFLAQVQTIRRLAQPRPAMGRRKVFIIADAEHLVPQESSPEAANALLKVLEEPPTETTFILTSSGPNTLLPTIHSRLLPIRLQPLPQDEVAQILGEQLGVDQRTAEIAARLAQGSIGRALGFLPSNGEPGPLEAQRQQARQLLAAIGAASPVQRLAAAHAMPPTGARGTFTELLDSLSIWLRDLAAISNDADEYVTNRDGLEFLRDLNERLPSARTAVPTALLAIEEAHDLAQGNVNPQLTLAWLLKTLHQILAAKE